MLFFEDFPMCELKIPEKDTRKHKFCKRSSGALPSLSLTCPGFGEFA